MCICGTRPEIIKLSPIIRECEKFGLDFFILHTGQHYSYEMDGVFFEQLRLPKPKYNLKVGSGTHAEMTGKMLLGIEDVLSSEKPSIVLVEGDTDTALAGALASAKIGIRVGHVEAGLRSYDRSMPEEINRVLADHCSDYLFAPTENAKRILLGEGIPNDKVFVTGNTIVDAVRQNADLGHYDSEQAKNVVLKYMLATVHRQENVDSRERFSSIIAGLERVADEFEMPVLYPIHPRARKRMSEFGLKVSDNIRISEPVDYLKMLWLEKWARLILTDSGGLQEEGCIIGTPCVTLRDNTERPETIEVGANVLAGAMEDKILQCAEAMVGKSGWSNPFGDGKAAERIIEIVRRENG